MNIVFFNALSELEKARLFFPVDDFVFARIVRSEKDWNSFKQFAQQNHGQKFCAVLEKTDSRLVQKARQADFLVGILGKSPKHCLFCVQQKIDFLFQPFGFGRSAWDLSILRIAKQNKVNVGLFFSDVLNALPRERIKWFENAFFLGLFCRKMKVGLVAFSGAFSFEETRCQEDLKSFQELLLEGFS
ncbi:hypothetical protein KKE06_02785 [Candidatus Micrarchaeota archaeon]|nr:hypothetical protein [Candidatus Micrarchaeota archaeon]MBU1930123.1 hypothetical protein [Candidatus Micrarchaeota archaeon]